MKQFFLILVALMFQISLFGQGYINPISVTDGSAADWEDLPSEYVASAMHEDGCSMNGLRSVRVYADHKYINVLLEVNLDVVTDFDWTPLHMFINTDNSAASGGYGDEFADADADIMLETAIYQSGAVAYNPAVFKWWGEVGGSGWLWVDPENPGTAEDGWGAVVPEGSLPIGEAQMVNGDLGNVEIQIQREYIPATWNHQQFTIGFDIQQNWTSVGILPNAADDAFGGAMLANKLVVNVDNSRRTEPYSYNIRVKQGDACDMDASNGLYLWWWSEQDGSVGNEFVATTLQGGCYTATITSTATAISCLVANGNDWQKGPKQTVDFANITGDICLEIGDDNIYSAGMYKYTLSEITCPEPVSDFVVRIQPDEACDMDLSNGLYLYWWKPGESGQVATMTLDSEGWWTATVTTDAIYINCLAVNKNVDVEGWDGHQQTRDYNGVYGNVDLKMGNEPWGGGYYLYDPSVSLSDLVLNQDCGKLTFSWKGDAYEYYWLLSNEQGMILKGEYLYGTEATAFITEEGIYTLRIYAMDGNGNFAGAPLEHTFTANLDGCVDYSISDLGYSINDYNEAVITWNSVAPAYRVRMFDRYDNELVSETVYENSYKYPLSEVGGYRFEVTSLNSYEEVMSDPSYLSIYFLGTEPLDWTFNRLYQNDYGGDGSKYYRGLSLQSDNNSASMSVNILTAHAQSIVGTYIFGDRTTAAQITYVFMNYRGIYYSIDEEDPAFHIVDGVMTISKNENDEFVVQFELRTEAGEVLTGVSTIANYAGNNLQQNRPTALSASQALSLTQNLPDYNLTTMPYFVEGIISEFDNTPEEIATYGNARFYISDDGTTSNQFYCYKTKWLDNTRFTTGDEIALADHVVVYGHLQNYRGTTPEIAGYIYYVEVPAPTPTPAPTADDLAAYEQEGYYVVCVEFQGEVCNDIVFAGNYNGWSTNVADMVYFEPLPGFEGWYVAVVPLTHTDYYIDYAAGKPVQLDNSGNFSWDFQTGDYYSWELVSGYVAINHGFADESDLEYYDPSAPIVLRSFYFKNNPCNILPYTYTVSLYAPECGGYAPAIYGGFNNWSEIIPMTLQADGSYQHVFSAYAGSDITFCAVGDTSNPIRLPMTMDDFSEGWMDVYFTLGEETDIVLDYTYGKYALCEEEEYVAANYHDFEDHDTNGQWRFAQNGQTNQWIINTAAGSVDGGVNALYITNNGYDYYYDEYSNSVSWAYIPISLIGAETISFDWKGQGESTFDNLSVYLFPKGYKPQSGNESVPDGAICLEEQLSGQEDWVHTSLLSTYSGEYNLCFRWKNDGSVRYTPIALDNISIAAATSLEQYPLTYLLHDDLTASVVACDPSYAEALVIPSTVSNEGVTYTVTAIEEEVFSGINLTAVEIPNTVTTIGARAFKECYALENVTLPNQLTRIEEQTFYSCESLRAITIPNSVDYIGRNAFSLCYNMTSLDLGMGVQAIAYAAFAECSSLQSLYIPASVTSIELYAFFACSSLTSIEVDADNWSYDSRYGCNAVISKVDNSLVIGCATSTIPTDVSAIGTGAFSYCYNLTQITIPDNIQRIGSEAFYFCRSLQSVDLGAGVSYIGSYAFAGCNALTSVIIPESVTEIGYYAFTSCQNVVMESATPPTVDYSTFKDDVRIQVPCDALATYQSTEPWYNWMILANNYQLTLDATEGGSAQVIESDCATNSVTIEAYPAERYVFTQWSDGNTDNPRTLTLTEDIALTAEFSRLTYPVTNLVVTTNCGNAYASWEGDAPYYELTMYSIDGTVVLYAIVSNEYKDGVSNVEPFEEGDYYWQVIPMYSDIEGDYAGEAVQAPFTISADNCVDLGVYNLNYTINGETVNITWESEAPLYHIWMYDYNYNVLEEKFIDTKNYSITLSEVGQYHFGIRGNNADATQFSEYSELDIDFVNDEIHYDLNFVYGEQYDYGPWNDAYERPILLYSSDYQTVMRIYPMPKYENSIIGTYFVENNTDNLYAGGMWGDGCYIEYRGISTGAIQSGMVTIARNEENQFVVSFDLTDVIGNHYTNACTIDMAGNNIADDDVTALSASQALTLTQNLPDYNMTAMPYFVEGRIATMHNTPEQIVNYGNAIFDISEDGTANNAFKCYQTKWLNNTNFTTGDEIALNDSVVVYGPLQHYNGSIPEIKGYIYQHFAQEVAEPCYMLTVMSNNDSYGYVDIAPHENCYMEGDVVTLTAQPYAGYEFVDWSDGITDAQRTLYMVADTELTANFRVIETPGDDCYTLNLYPEQLSDGMGGYAYAAPNYECYEPNTEVRLSAFAAKGYVFSHWNDGNTDAQRTIVMTRDMSFTAYFELEYVPECYTLTVEETEGGRVDVDPSTNDCYEEGTNVSLTAVAEEGYEFVTWSDGETAMTRTITMNADYTVKAIFRLIDIPVGNFTLTVTSTPGGTVIKDPDQAYYAADTRVLIEAQADEGYKFVEWNDGETSELRRVTITQDTIFHAIFELEVPLVQYTLTLTAGEGGSVKAQPQRDYYNEGDVVQIKAIPNEGYEFVEWSDGNTTAVRQLVMNRNYTLSATFQRMKTEYDIADLTIKTSGMNATATWTSKAEWFRIIITDSSDKELKNEVVNLTDEKKSYKYKAPKAGTYTFSVEPLDNTDAHNSLGAVVTKNFTTERLYSLYIYADNGGTVNEEVNGSYKAGEQVQIKATPNSGYRFSTWSDGDTNATRTLTMDQDYDLMASFKRIPTYDLTIYEGEHCHASMAAGSYTYQENEVVTLTATADEGYIFAYWMVNNEERSEAALTLTMDQDYTVYPVAQALPTYILTILPSEFGQANMVADSYTYNEGDEVTLYPVADKDYLFDYWTVNGENVTDSLLVLVMDKDYEVKPWFKPNKVGVENIFDNITVEVHERTILVEASSELDYLLYDLVGHLVGKQLNTRSAYFTVPSAGLYLLRTRDGVKKIRVE